MVRTTQKDKIMDYMRYFGSITTLEAFRDLGITRLSARIFDLRRCGVEIVNVQEKGTNRFGEPVHWDRYFLADVYNEMKESGVLS